MSCTASSRELAKATKLARSNVVKAIDSLNARTHISTRQGGATRSATHRINLLQTVTLPRAGGGPATGPPPDLRKDHLVSQQVQYLDLRQDHPGLTAGPPPTENKGLTAPALGLDIDSEAIEVIDRLNQAKAKDFTPDQIDQVRRFLHGFMVKLGADPDAHPPDARLCAQILALAPWDAVQGILYDLMGDRHSPTSYGWFLAVVLQRFHSVTMKQVRQRRAHLKLMKSSPEYRDFSGELLAGAVQKVKSL